VHRESHPLSEKMLGSYVDEEEIGQQQQQQVCARNGCNAPIQKECRGCGVVGYCSDVHAQEHWKNHVKECNICEDMGNATWTVEREYVAEQHGETEDAVHWLPDDMVHAKINTVTGEVEGIRINEDLVAEYDQNYKPEHIDAVASFKGKTVVHGSDINRVAKGRTINTGENGVIKVYIRSGEDVFVENTILFQATAHHKSPIKWGKGGGWTFRFDKEYLEQRIRSQVPADGEMYISLIFRGQVYRLWGIYQIRDEITSKKLLRRVYQRTRREYGRGIAWLRGASQKIRVKGQDRRNVQASFLFNRDRASLTKTGTELYRISELEFHVPPQTTPDVENVSDDMTYEEIKYFLDDQLRAGTGPRKYTNARVDAESLEEVSALVDAICDEQDELREAFIEAQTQNPDEAARIQQELNTVGNIHATLVAHMNTLQQEEEGTMEAENIDPTVYAAIANGQELIAGQGFFRRKWGKAKYWKRVKNMSLGEKVREFIDRVQELKGLRDAGRQGTDVLEKIELLRTGISESKERMDRGSELEKKYNEALKEYADLKSEAVTLKREGIIRKGRDVLGLRRRE